MSTAATSPTISERRTSSVLHVLPHPGGGGERYVDLLERMEGYRFERLYLADDPRERRPDRLLAAAARVAGAARNHALLHVHGEGAAYLSLPALARKPSLVTLHGINVLRRSAGLRRRLAGVGLRIVVAAADCTICVSETEYDEVSRALGAGAQRKVVLVRNGILQPDMPEAGTRQAVRHELGIPEDSVLALAVGGLEPVKGPLTAARAAIEAARSVPLVLAFAGDGPLRGELERLAAQDGGSAVRLLGQRDDLDRIYAAADILVLASFRETLGFAVLEGMAHGLAPLVSDGVGCAEAAGDAALVARAGDAASFADGLRRLAADPAGRASRGERGRARAAELFSAAEMIERTREIYDEVLA
jgi:glycosyltransferase involved in cell wall biosynthesis